MFCPFNLFHVHAFLVHLPKRGHFTKLCNLFFDELDGEEGILVASKIADRIGITRSVIVNALRKFESAGVIESRSSGMKGTYIKVLNDVVFDELAKVKVSAENTSGTNA